jgi:hypothetical protein
MNRKNKKGQAAMEYLMTYGWVLLTILVIIAILFSSGILDRGSIISQECTLIPDLPCLTPAGQQDVGVYIVYMNISNGLGYPILIKDIRMTDLTSNVLIANGGGTDGIVQTTNYLLNPGDTVIITGKFNGEAENEIRTFFINLQYFRQGGGSGNERWVSGRIKTKIESQ